MTRLSTPALITGALAALLLTALALAVPLDLRHSAPFGFSRTFDDRRGIAVRGGFVTANFPDFHRLDLDLRAYNDVPYDLTVNIRPASPGAPVIRRIPLNLPASRIWHAKAAFADPFLTVEFPPIAGSAGQRYYVWVETGPRNRDNILALWSIKSYSAVPGRVVLAALLDDLPGDVAPNAVTVALILLLGGTVAAFGWLIAGLLNLVLRATSPRP